MANRTLTRRLFVLFLTAAFVSVSSAAGRAANPQAPSGELTATGQVMINGQNAVSGTTVFSGSTITTARGSSAVVSLGKLGRVEIMPDSNAQLTFTDNGIMLTLNAGRVRISTPVGVDVTVTTKDGTAVADNTRANTFIVDLECGNTEVKTEIGQVTLRSGGSTEIVPAGDTDYMGSPLPGTRCAAPTGGVPGGDLGAGRVLSVLVGVGAVVAALILVVSRGGEEDVQPPGPPNPSAIG